jgi:LacI family transcriptional regulator
MTVTLKQIGEIAGVSVSTASRVLNGHAREFRISPATEQLVRETAKDLNFRPNQIARSLQSRQTKLIGVVVPDISNPFFAAIARQVTLDAEEKGYCVLLADSRDETSMEEKLLDRLIDRQVDGLVVCPVGLESKHLEAINASGLPLVVVDRGFEKSPIVTVTSDHCAAAERVARLLIDRGHREIGVLQGTPGALPNEQRLKGFRRALAKRHIPFAKDRVAGGNFSEQSGYESAKCLLARYPQITALFACSTPNALGGMRAAQEVGRSVPSGISIVAFDDSPFADFMAAPLTTASQDEAELGRTAARLVIGQISSETKPRKKLHVITMKIIDRDSVSDLKVR